MRLILFSRGWSCGSPFYSLNRVQAVSSARQEPVLFEDFPNRYSFVMIRIADCSAVASRVWRSLATTLIGVMKESIVIRFPEWLRHCCGGNVGRLFMLSVTHSIR